VRVETTDITQQTGSSGELSEPVKKYFRLFEHVRNTYQIRFDYVSIPFQSVSRFPQKIDALLIAWKQQP
jgi:hypothetical protein